MNIDSIWEYKIQVLPIIISFLITELPNIVRKYKRFYYIPIYFTIFPLRELNPNLAHYLGEDFYTGFGYSLDEKGVAKLKKKIIIDSVISIFISAIVLPSVIGFLFSLYLNMELYFQAILVIFSYKSINIIRAVVGFKEHAVASKKNIAILIIIYLGYLGVFFQLLNNSYDWARPFVLVKNYRGLLFALSDLIFNKGIAQGLLLAGLAAFFSNLITDKKIRDENIKNGE